MRRRLILSAAVSAVFLGAEAAQAQVLFTTAADFGGSTLANDPTQSGWEGWGDRGEDFPPNPSTSNLEDLVFTPATGSPDLDGSTTNGVGNYNNNNDNDINGTGMTDPNFTGNSLVSYSGKTSPGGSMTIEGYGGGYDTVTTSEMFEGGTATGNTPFVNALTQNGSDKGILKITFNSPLGGTTLNTSSYYLIGFLTYSNDPAFASQWVNPANGSAGDPDRGLYGDQPGAYAVLNPGGASWTGYIPYNLNPKGTLNPYQYLQFGIILNSGSPYAGVGNVTIDDIEALPLNNTYSYWEATSGSTTASWSTATNWSSLGIPSVAGDMASFMGIGTSNGGGNTAAPAETVTLDGNYTVGNIHFDNASSYTIAPGTGGILTIANTNGNSANIEVNRDNYTNSVTHYISAPLVLASNTIVNVNNAGDGLTVSGAVSGPGNLTLNGAGTTTLSGLNSYGGSGTGTNSATVVNNGTLIVAAAGALPPGGALMNSAIVDVNANSQTGQITGGGTLNVAAGKAVQLAKGSGASTQLALVLGTGSTLDITNNSFTVDFGTAAGAVDPATTIRAELISGFNASGAKWAGTGITSSTAAANPTHFVLGYADGNNAKDLANVGSSLSAGNVKIMYTVAGDANLSGSVDLSDLVIIASDFGQSGADWAEGDLNYDGNVDLSDLVIVASNFGASLSSVQAADFSSSFAAEWQLALAEAHGADVTVPEPTLLGVGIVGACGLMARRRRGWQA